MSKKLNPNYKLTDIQRMQVLAMLARGDRYARINAFLQENYGVQLHISNFTQMKQRHSDTIQAMKETITTHVALESEVLMSKSRKLLNKKLDRAEQDAEELEELDRLYREGEITPAEYKRMKSTRYDITIGELNQVSKDMFAQSKFASSDPDQSPKNGDANAQNTEALLDAIKAGNTVELQRLILNPKVEE